MVTVGPYAGSTSSEVVLSGFSECGSAKPLATLQISPSVLVAVLVITVLGVVRTDVVLMTSPTVRPTYEAAEGTDAPTRLRPRLLKRNAAKHSASTR